MEGEKTFFVLLGDIGGTNSRLQLAKVAESYGKAVEIKRQDYEPSKAYPSLNFIIKNFLEGLKAEERPIIASIGLAGPVENNECTISNLKNWPKITVEDLKAEFGFEQVFLLNDLEAAAIGLTEISPDYLVRINSETSIERKNKLKTVIGPGTGLGYSFLVPTPAKDGFKYTPFPSEGGHADFAPQTDIQIDLLRYLQKESKGKNICIEKCLAGNGYQELYKFIKSRNPSYQSEIEKVHPHPKNREITQFGIEGKDENCVEFVKLLTEMLVTEISNTAARTLCYSGIYVIGTIVNSLKDYILKDIENNFTKHYLNKENESILEKLNEIPVYILTYQDPALHGAFIKVKLFLRGE